MSLAPDAPRALTRLAAPTAGTGLRDALHGEWTKLRTAPGTFWLVSAAVALTVAVSAAAAAATRCPATGCGLDPAKVSLTGILDVYSFPGSDVVVVVYAAEVTGGEPKACDECLEVRAFPPESIPWDELAFDSTRAALKDYIHRFFPRARLAR